MLLEHAPTPELDTRSEDIPLLSQRAMLAEPEQEEMEGEADMQPQSACSCSVREVFDTIVSGVLAVLMAIIMIPLGIPAAFIVFTLGAMGEVYQACGGSSHDWSLFVAGAVSPGEVAEECNREVVGRSEALRGKGPWPNFVYHVSNNHPILGLFCCAHGHPFSPVQRFGLLVLLVSFGYFMGGVKTKVAGYLQVHPQRWNHDEEIDWLLIDCYSLICISLPSMFLQSTLKYFALLDYKYRLEKSDYFARTRMQRCRAFAKQFCIDRSLGRPPPERPSRGGGGSNFLQDLCDCCNACCETIKLCSSCLEQCEEGQTHAVNALFATLFAGIALTGSCLFIFFGIRMDRDSSEDVWQTFCIGLAANFFGLWFLMAGTSFSARWLYDHWQGGRIVIGERCIPPETEHLRELDCFFTMADSDRDGFLGKNDVEYLVKIHLAQDLSEEGWLQLLAELDEDQDGRLSLSEIQALRTEFAVKTGWWVRGHGTERAEALTV